MTEAVQLELAKGVSLMVAAIPGMFAAYFAYKSHMTSQETQAITRDTQTIAKKTEENTNHLKDELVEEVRKASIEIGRAQVKSETQEGNPTGQQGRNS